MHSAVACVLGGCALGQTTFTDVTCPAGVTTSQGIGNYVFQEYVGGGAVGDFDNDGWQDLFVIKGDGRDRLFMNNHDGTFTDVGEGAGMLAHHGKGACAGDFNDDGWLDIYVTSAGPIPGAPGPGNHILYRNNGDGTFTNVASDAGVNWTSNQEDGFSAAFGDFDLDGDLDLFVAGFTSGNLGSRLFRNDGDESFTDVTAASQIFNGVISMSAFTPRFVDLDQDFYPEMALISDFDTSRTFGNNQDGTYSDITVAAGLGHEENGMGGNIGDLDNDGLIDMYVSSIYSPGIGWTGNKLYLNQGVFPFDEVAAEAGVDDGGYGWGVICADFDNDGLQDILETNGGNGAFEDEQCYLFMNQGDGSFDELAIESGITHDGQGRGMAEFDYDNDGDRDVVIFANNEPITLYRNDGTPNAWLRVFLDTGGSPGLAPDGEGARVFATATIGGEVSEQFRLMSWGSNFESSSELSVHFGLGDAAVVDEVRVEWPDGSVTTLGEVAINQTMTIASGGCAGDFNGDGVKNILDFVAFQAGWLNGDEAADCDANGLFNILDFVCFQSAFGEPCE